MLNSKHLLLVIGSTTKEDTDWVPFEIRYAVDECEIPIIAAYPGKGSIRDVSRVSSLWPEALKIRINDGRAHVIHIPFKKSPIADAIGQFDPTKYPKGGGRGRYTDQAYRNWNLL